MTRVLFIGDVVGRPGRQALGRYVRQIARDRGVDLVLANGENAAGGRGITPAVAEEMFSLGVVGLSLGDHAFDKSEAHQLLASDPRVIRPGNYPPGAPGQGQMILRAKNGRLVGLINLMGRVFMGAHLDDPFRTADRLLEEVTAETPLVIVDFHAEATSEKAALGWYLDGRVSAVLGTHTHVQTADELVLPGGTAFITDVGMTGPVASVIGVEAGTIVKRFLDQLPAKFEVARGPVLLSAVVVDIDDESGRALSIERLLIREPMGPEWMLPAPKDRAPS